MISTRDLSQLPDVDGLRRLLQSMAMLDAILWPEWQFRWYSFNSRWAKGEQMGSMRNGHGDSFFALFNSHGCFLKGFAHEAPMTPYRADPERVWPGVLDSVPAEFEACLREPAFGIEDTTFCIWRRYADGDWQRGTIEFPPGKDPDGSEFLLSPLDGKPETYREWAEWYFNKRFLTVEMVRHIYEQRPLTDDLVAALTPDMDPPLEVTDLQDDIAEIAILCSSMAPKPSYQPDGWASCSVREVGSMDRVGFADELRRQIVVDWRRFRAAHPDETPYAYALLGGQSPSLGSVVATEEGLQRVAAKYVKRGWRYGNVTEPTPLTAQLLASWLRWANPDDGWYFGGLPDEKEVQVALAALAAAGGLGEGGKGFEEFCTDVLASLRDVPEWREEMARCPVVVGFTYGEDPRDFLRTATRANPYPVVRRLWAEYGKADELRRQIRSPYDRRAE